MITFEDFKKMELRVAKILQAKDHPNADKLYVLNIDLGGRTKQIVAGIRSFYKKEELTGRQIVVVDNLEPALLRGVESQGMLLAVSDGRGISIISPDREVEIGSQAK